MQFLSGFLFFLFVFLFSSIGDSLSAFPVPELRERVTDLAGILNPETKAKLTQVLELQEQNTSNQVAILTIPSLEGESIEEVAIQVFDVWKLGQKSKANGVLFLIAKDDRKMRIEVGRGLEGDLPDILSSRIIKQIVKPYFKQGDFDRGVWEGTQAILSSIDKSYTPSSDDVITTKKRKGSGNKDFSSVFGSLLIGFIFTFVAIRLDGAARFIFWTIGFFLIFGALYLFLSKLFSILLALLTQGIATAFSLASQRNNGGGGGTFSGGWGGGYGAGSWGSGSWGGGDSWSGGGSDWGGGGGDSGGGGASGDW